MHVITVGSFPPRYADRYGGIPAMGETTPPPDDRFPKVFSMTSAAYQPAGARGGFAKPQTAEAEADKGEEGRNETGDGGDVAGTASETVKNEAVINEAAEEKGAELEQGSCKAIAQRALIEDPEELGFKQ